jgi:uncharacterized SAM-binding protein YcdF (DUF218 family)
MDNGRQVIFWAEKKDLPNDLILKSSELAQLTTQTQGITDERIIKEDRSTRVKLG